MEQRPSDAASVAPSPAAGKSVVTLRVRPWHHSNSPQVVIRRRAPWMQLVMTTHDELVYIVSDTKAKAGLKIVEEVMREPPAWMPDLPLAVEAEISQFYSK